MKSIIKMVSVLSVLCAVAGFVLSYLKISTVTPIENQLLTYVQGPAMLKIHLFRNARALRLVTGKKSMSFLPLKTANFLGLPLKVSDRVLAVISALWLALMSMMIRL